MLPESLLYLTGLKPNLNVTSKSLAFFIKKIPNINTQPSIYYFLPSYFLFFNFSSSVYSISCLHISQYFTASPSVLLLWQMSYLYLSTFVMEFLNKSYLFLRTSFTSVTILFCLIIVITIKKLYGWLAYF